MLVQVYVDDIIFGSTKKSMCTKFKEVMHKRFQMSSMGELTLFLGLQFDFCSIKTTTTPIESNKPLVKDEDGVEVDVHEYRSMIGSLMYLTASRPGIMFAVCACARFQVTLKASHLHAIKRIFRYLKHQPKLGLWYPRDSPFELEAFFNSDYAGANLYRKSCKKKTIVANSTTEAEYVAAAHCFGQVLWIQNQMMDYGFHFMNTKIHIDNESTICVVKNPVYHSRTKHIEIRHHFIRDCYEKRLIDVLKIHTDSNVADLLTKGFDVTRFNFLVISMDLRMDRSSPGKYNSSMVCPFSLKKPNESVGFTEVVDFLKGTSLKYALTHNSTIYDSLVKQFWQTATVRTLANGTQQLITSIDSKEYTITEASVRRDIVPLLPAMLAGAAVDQGEGSSQLAEPHHIPDTKQILGNAVLTLVKKVKYLETALKRKSKKGVGKEKSTDNGKRYRRRARSMAKKIDTGLDAEEEINTGREEINTGIEEVSTGSTKVDSGTASKRGQREGKAPMVEEDIQATHKTKEQLRQEEAGLEEAIKLQAQLDEEVAKQIHLDKMIAQRMAEEEALTEQQKKRKAQVQFEAQFYTEEDWDTIRAKLEANAELSKDVLGQDLPEQDFAKRMVDMVNQRKKHFAEERAKAKRNKPMTQSQLRIYMSIYMLKKLKFEEIKEEFDKLVQQIDTFVPINLEATKAKLKRYREELQTKTSKKQRFDEKDVPAIGDKVAEVKEEESVKRIGKRKKQKARKGVNVDKSAQEDSETDKEESVEAMNPTPLTTKSDSVVNWKIFQQGQRSIYQIMKANSADTVYMSFGAMVKDFTREDLIKLYRLVMQKYGTNRPEDTYDRVIWSDLRTMFDPPLNEDAIWSLPLQQKMVSWRYYDKCEVHCLTLEACTIYMLADRKYPLSKDACQVMLKMKLLDGKMNEVCYKLLKMIEKLRSIKQRDPTDLLFQPLFDELLTPSPSVDYPAPEVVAPILEVVAPVPAVSIGSPSSTNVDQDAPSPSNSQTTPETQPLVIPNDVEEDNHDIEVAHMGNDPYFGIPIPEVHFDQSSSSDIIHTIQALFCYYDSFLTAVEPKTYKDAFIQACWIEAMQEELNEFERLGVWELIPRPDKVMVITLKWIYKVKLDKLGGILKNKAWLVARGYRQEEGIDFEESFAPVARTWSSTKWM
ncbi:putative ribonuclease H-like domain-containing protein [Tanacetum coccineum]